MSLLGSLEVSKGSTHKKKIVGRGDSSGWGGTSGKGHKGQSARKGKGKNIRGFEGGQTPLSRRMPKVGFTNTRFKTNYDVVTLSDLNKVKGEVTPEALRALGLVGNTNKVKLLANGELKVAVKVKLNKVTQGAKAAIEKLGGSVEEVK